MSKEKLDQLAQEIELFEKYTRENWQCLAEISASIIRKLSAEIIAEQTQARMEA